MYIDALKSSEIEAVVAEIITEMSTQKFKLPQDFSIFFGEFCAISKALQQIQNQDQSKAIIFFDAKKLFHG